MNDLLQVKLPFGHNSRKGQVGPSVLPAFQSVNTEKILGIITQLEEQIAFWKEQSIIPGALVSVEYTKVVAKSNRIRQIMSYGVKDINDCIKGAKFVGDDNSKRHVITYYIKINAIRKTIDDLNKTVSIINTHYHGAIKSSDIESINKTPSKNWMHAELAKTKFVNLVVDCFYIKSIYKPTPEPHTSGNNIITIYNTNYNVIEKMHDLGIELTPDKVLNDYTIILTDDQYSTLSENASFLIAMSLSDLTKVPPITTIDDYIIEPLTLDKPNNEPTIGVIDSFFEGTVYFSDWVDVHDMIPSIGITDDDRFHGTAVDSLIVDGARINPELDDGCGNFRVRHFSVMTARKYSSVSIVKNIKKIIAENRDIKVWNISLGSDMETNQNFISYEASELDALQNKYDVIFVIAGTNDKEKTMKKHIGAPADSINALVVNAVNRYKAPASYSRKGPVLSFYNKPDIAYYGGDKGSGIRVCSKNGEIKVLGTSFAAPYISRKLAYLIHVIGLSREVAKALIIDSTIGWTANTTNNISDFIGMGIVPTHINDILNSKDDEIRFVFTGEATEYDNYCYSIPVPISKSKQPYIAKATLCYFPESSRDQGVDYTTTELDLHFGRIVNKTIRTINDNLQNTDNARVYEKEARSYHRKWDNVKVICETLKRRGRPKDVKDKGLWGISIKRTVRNNKRSKPISFGMVVTLKNINGDNLIQDFIQQCAWNNILVTPIHINQSIDIYNKMSEDIILE